MASVNEFLRSFEFNGSPLQGQGSIDPSLGGFTTSNAPLLFAQLLTQLSQPGGALAELGLNQILAGQTGGLVAQSEVQRDQTLSQLAESGANPATAAIVTGGLDQQLLEQISGARASAQQNLQQQQQQAQTQFTNVLAQAEDTQKVRTEQLRQFEALRKDIKDQQKFSRTLGIASLAAGILSPIISRGVSKLGDAIFGEDGFEAATTAASTGPSAAFSVGGGIAGGIQNLALQGQASQAPAAPVLDPNAAIQGILQGIFGGQGGQQATAQPTVGTAGPAPSAPQFEAGTGSGQFDIEGLLQQLGGAGQVSVQ